MALGKIIKKNFKLLIRSKSSALIVILGPLLIIFLVGIAFDNINTYSIDIGTYSESYSELSESFIDKMVEKEFRVKKVDSEEGCINKIKKGELHVCIVFPKDLKVASKSMNEIIFHVDNSKINLVWMILETLSTKLSERSQELSIDLTNTLLEKLNSAKSEVHAKKPTVINLKTENKEMKESLDSSKKIISSFKMDDIIKQTDDVETYFMEKIDLAEDVLTLTKTKVSASNASESQKDTMTTKLAEMNTIIYNMKTTFQRNDSQTSKWADLQIMLDDFKVNLNLLTSDLNSIGNKLDSSASKLNEVQISLDKIYKEIEEIQVKNAATIVEPISTTIKPVTAENTYLNYLFPALIVMVVMFISILLSTTLVMMEKHSPAYFRNFITPTREIIFILGTYLTGMIIVSIQLVIIMAIAAYFFSTQILSSLLPSVFILLLITTMFVFIGMLIGYWFNSEETGTLAAISAGSVMLFISNVILPLESMPDYVRNIAQYNPFVISENILRKIIIFKIDLLTISNDILILLGVCAGLFIIIFISEKVAFGKIMHKYYYNYYKRHKKKKFSISGSKRKNKKKRSKKSKKTKTK